MNHSPADILLRYLLDAGIASSASLWEGFVGFQPDLPDDVISIYDTTSIQDGRLMSGETINHPGFQVRVRSNSRILAYRKVSDISSSFDAVLRTAVEMEGSNYTLQSIRQGAPIPLGLEQDRTPARHLFVLNGSVTVKQI